MSLGRIFQLSNSFKTDSNSKIPALYDRTVLLHVDTAVKYVICLSLNSSQVLGLSRLKYSSLSDKMIALQISADKWQSNWIVIVSNDLELSSTVLKFQQPGMRKKQHLSSNSRQNFPFDVKPTTSLNTLKRPCKF